MADLSTSPGFPRAPLRTAQNKSPYGGSDSPVQRKSPSKWGNRQTGDESIAAFESPIIGKTVHEHKITEKIEDKTSISVGTTSSSGSTGKGCDNNSNKYGYGVYAIGFIVLFIIIFLIVLAALYFGNAECVSKDSRDCGTDNGKDDYEVDFWKAGIFAFIIAIIIVILIAGLCYACSSKY